MAVANLTRRSRVPGWATRAGSAEPLVIAALVVLAVVVIVAALGQWMIPYVPDALYVGPTSSGPSAAHFLGTDDLGRDIFSRLLVATRSSLLGPIAVVVASTAAGTALAVAAAWFGGWWDGLTGRVVDVIFAIPGLVLAVLSVAMFGKGIWAPVIALSIAYIPLVARLVGNVARHELGMQYVAALRVQGVSGWSICLRHLLPAITPAILAQASVGFGYAMLDLAAISYLGLGVQPPAADWGSMIAGGQSSIMSGAPEQSLFAAIAVVVTVLAVNVLGARVTEWAEGKGGVR